MAGQNDTLDELIAKAAKEAHEAQARQASRNLPGRAPSGMLKLTAWVAICAIATGWAILQLLGVVLPASQGQLRNDLVLAAEQARQEIEAARKRDGVLPTAIPNAALANLVNYEIKGTGYRLVVLTARERLEMNETGAQVISKRESAP